MTEGRAEGGAHAHACTSACDGREHTWGRLPVQRGLHMLSGLSVTRVRSPPLGGAQPRTPEGTSATRLPVPQLSCCFQSRHQGNPVW